MKYTESILRDITSIKTGKLNSNAATIDGEYPFFTCDPITLRTKTYSFDTEAVLLAGNNASGNYTAKYYCGKFDVYQRTYVIQSTDKDVLNVRYLSYAINQKLHRLKMMSSGSTTKFLTIGMLHNLEIPLPKIEIQCKIADIISSYDNLIENNQKQIKLLEEAAMKLYKEWFVKLRFPGYETTKIIDDVPEEWYVLNIGSLLGYEIGGGWGEENISKDYSEKAWVIRGTDIEGINNGEIRSIPYRYHKRNNLSARQIKPGDIIFEVSGGSKTIGVAKSLLISKTLLDYLATPVICASFCKMIRPMKLEYAYYLYHTLQYLRATHQTEKFEKRSASSIINYRWKDFLEEQQILVPNDNTLHQYNSIAIPMYELKSNLSTKIEMLRIARDSILPRLMSGEIEV